MAKENSTWGYTRIVGAMKNLGHDVVRMTVARVPAEHGIGPAPERSKEMSWSEFLRIHWDRIGATDFFTVEVLTLCGLTRYHVLFCATSSPSMRPAFTPSAIIKAWAMS